jgi:8-oxo-dGTP diphosphatase
MALRQLFPLVSADVALFTIGETCLQVLLVERGEEPLKGSWALPGAVLKPSLDADLEATARRALRDKLGVEVPFLEQIHTFNGAERDPRGWSVAVLHTALLPRERLPASAGRKVERIRWSDVDSPGPLAFDHRAQLTLAVTQLRERVGNYALPLHLLPEKFTLTELQKVCETILRTGRNIDAGLDKGAFRRRIAGSPDLELVPDEFRTGAQRPAQLYRAAPGFRF